MLAGSNASGACFSCGGADVRRPDQVWRSSDGPVRDRQNRRRRRTARREISHLRRRSSWVCLGRLLRWALRKCAGQPARSRERGGGCTKPRPRASLNGGRTKQRPHRVRPIAKAAEAFGCLPDRTLRRRIMLLPAHVLPGQGVSRRRGQHQNRPMCPDLGPKWPNSASFGRMRGETGPN